MVSLKSLPVPAPTSRALLLLGLPHLLILSYCTSFLTKPPLTPTPSTPPKPKAPPLPAFVSKCLTTSVQHPVNLFYPAIISSQVTIFLQRKLIHHYFHASQVKPPVRKIADKILNIILRNYW